MGDTLERGLARVLWMPPSLPTWRPRGPFAALGGVTKSLVFWAWNVVPDAIAALCSYEAERRAVSDLARTVPYSELYEALKPLLRCLSDYLTVQVPLADHFPLFESLPFHVPVKLVSVLPPFPGQSA